MHARSPNGIEESVLMGIMSNSCPVLKLNTFYAVNMKVDRIHMRFWHKRTVAPPPVDLIGTALEHKANRRMMDYLLHVDNSAVFMGAGKGFSKNWV